jgi:hypothetical protein
MSGQRSNDQVLDDHLTTSLNGDVEDDLRRNYADDVTVVSNWGVAHGHDGVRGLAELLRRQLPGCTFTYRLRIVDGEIGLLQWTADSAAGAVRDGVDAYVLRDGLIRAQTIYYTLQPGG